MKRTEKIVSEYSKKRVIKSDSGKLSAAYDVSKNITDELSGFKHPVKIARFLVKSDIVYGSNH